MENRTKTNQAKRYLELKEKIEAKEYFEVFIYHHPLFLIYGKGNVKYEVTAKDMNEAIPKALAIHQEEFSHTNTEEDDPSYIKKCRVVRISNETILNNMWDGKLGSFIYMQYWEPDMEASELIRLLEKNEPVWFPYKAYYIETIWELDLLLEEPINDKASIR